jgi:cell wall-active antibiotic response 4TMS protein YvqF
MYRYRSFFWPGVLILAGVIALLVNTGVLPVDRLIELVGLWPLILIVLGLELIVRRTLRGTTGDVAAALIVLIAIAGAAAYVTLAPNPAATSSHDFSGDVGGLSQATVKLDVGAANVTMSGGGDLGAKLYRAHIDYSGTAPEVSFERESAVLTIKQPSSGIFGQSRKFDVTLQLNPSVSWIIDEHSGATNDTMQLGSLHVASIAINSGASRDDITLGAPSGPVQVRINGGALTVRLHRPSPVKFSVEVSGGASTLDVDGRTSHAVGKLQFATGDLGSDYYRIQVSGGACTVSLDTSAASD